MTATYLNVEVAPYELVSIYDLKIEHRFNEHATMSFSGILAEEKQDRYVTTTNKDMNVSVTETNENGEIVDLFHGLVKYIEITEEGNVYEIKVEAISHTYGLDTEKKSQTFQDVNLSYSDLIQQVLVGSAKCIDVESNGKTIEKPILRFNETDWEFLKRMASRFSTGLAPAATFSEAKLYFGIPSRRNKGLFIAKKYRVKKDFEQYYQCKPWVEGIHENHFMYVEAVSEDRYEIGDIVKFNGKELYIMAVNITMIKGMLEFLYTLSPEKGMSQPALFNFNIVGGSLLGKVIDTSKDKIKIHFSMDGAQDPGTAYWWPYATVFASEKNAGWFCMPEMGDDIRVYFPNHKEEDGFAMGSVQKK